MKLANIIQQLPLLPGVYFFKDKTGEIIYVGKASSLRLRVKQYFQNNRLLDSKTKALVGQVSGLDYIETRSEIEALFLESEMIKRYKPKYNILLRDDKSLIYIRIDMDNEWPYLSFSRNPLDDGAKYFGPYYNGLAVKKALRYLRRIFPYYDTKTRSARFVLAKQLGLEPVGMTSQQYKQNLRQLISYINGKSSLVIKRLELDMKRQAEQQNFELAGQTRDRLYNLKELQKQIVFGDEEFIDISKDLALMDISQLLSLKNLPARIEAFDISHMSGVGVVASLVVFINGVSSRADYRKFKIVRDTNDDFANMAEAVGRRFSQVNIKKWSMPDLVVVDGGRGQLKSAIEALPVGLKNQLCLIGLAKKLEQIIIPANQPLSLSKVKQLGGIASQSGNFWLIDLPQNGHVIKLLQRVRDESHRFAINYHLSLRSKRQMSSGLDEIIGVGPVSKQKLLKKFGSLKAIGQANLADIAKVVGLAKAKKIKANL